MAEVKLTQKGDTDMQIIPRDKELETLRRQLDAANGKLAATQHDLGESRQVIAAAAQSGPGAPADIWTVLDVAAALKLHKRTIYRLAKTKAIPARRIGGSWRFVRQDLIDYVKGGAK
jgi:excisionase family DNA binding protein